MPFLNTTLECLLDGDRNHSSDTETQLLMEAMPRAGKVQRQASLTRNQEKWPQEGFLQSRPKIVTHVCVIMAGEPYYEPTHQTM